MKVQSPENQRKCLNLSISYLVCMVLLNSKPGLFNFPTPGKSLFRTCYLPLFRLQVCLSSSSPSAGLLAQGFLLFRALRTCAGVPSSSGLPSSPLKYSWNILNRSSVHDIPDNSLTSNIPPFSVYRERLYAPFTYITAWVKIRTINDTLDTMKPTQKVSSHTSSDKKPPQKVAAS